MGLALKFECGGRNHTGSSTVPEGFLLSLSKRSKEMHRKRIPLVRLLSERFCMAKASEDAEVCDNSHNSMV